MIEMQSILNKKTKTMATLTIIRGIPNSGKSTYAKKNFHCLILEQDMMHEIDGRYQWKADRMKSAIDWCFSAAKLALENKMDVCVCNVFSRKAFITKYVDLAKMLGVNFKVIHVIGKDEWKNGNGHNVPETTIMNMKNAWEDFDGEEVVEAWKSES